MAPGVDDAGVRQYQVDEPGMQKVVRQLVDEARLALLALDAGALQILLADSAQLLDRQPRERLRIAQRLSAGALADGLRECRHVGQLHRALDLGVTGENLLYQRGARARQADDEDRIGGSGTGAGTLC